MQKIQQVEVYRKIEQAHRDEFSGHGAIRYRYSDFEMDMLSSGLIASSPTMRTKWKAAIADGVIQTTSSKLYEGNALLIIDELYSYVPRAEEKKEKKNTRADEYVILEVA